MKEICQPRRTLGEVSRSSTCEHSAAGPDQRHAALHTAGFQQLTATFTTSTVTGLAGYIHGWHAEPVYFADDISQT
jgi:hypothetical protein